MSKLRESLRALNQQLAAFEPEVENLDRLKADVQAEQARLKDVREKRVAEQAEFDKQVAARQRELAAMEKAKAEIGVDLKAWQVRISAAEEEAQTLEARNNSLRGQHDQILASINRLQQRLAA